MLKKSLATLFFGACAVLPFTASAMGNNPSCFELGLTGGWFKVGPNYRSFGTATTATTVDGVIPSGNILVVNPKYKFGGGAYLNYTPCGQPYAWGASYFTVTNSRSVSHSGIIGIGIGPARANDYASFASSSLKTRYQYANVYLGTTHALCCDVFHIKPHLGVAYLNYKDTHSTNFTTIDGVAGTAFFVENHSRYRGFGPEIGADLKYCFCGDFSLFGNFNYSALVGNFKGYHYFQPTNLATVSRTVTFSHGHDNNVVSHLQAEMGLGYCFNFWCFDRGQIMLGWRVTKMIDVSRRLHYVDDVAQTRFVDTFGNANLHGPFIRLAFGF